MPTFLEIAVNVPGVTDVYHYHLPPELEGRVLAGHLVIVPFGRQTVQGIILRSIHQPAVSETRPVIDLVDSEPVVTEHQLALASEMSLKNLAPLAECIWLMLPPGLSQQAETLYTLREHWRQNAGQLSNSQNVFLDLLEKRGPLRTRQIERALPRRRWQSTAQSLIQRGLVTSQIILPEPNVRPKTVRTVQLACRPAVAEQAIPNLGRSGTQALERRQAMLRFLLHDPGPVDVTWVYAESGGNLQDLRKLSEMGLVLLGESEVWRNPLAEYDFQPTDIPPLTRDQQKVWAHIQAAIRNASEGKRVSPLLLHGVTGSGKTELYQRAVADVLQLKKQAIILVPEIALTPQTVRRFVGRFPGQVGLLHSGLSVGERYDTWRRARAGDLSVIVGPRSALFTPFPKLGLVVVDESHDDSYFQSESSPRYNAREAAVAYAREAGAVCLLGSATPDITSTYRASQGEWRYLHLPARILAHRETVRAQLERLKADSVRFRPLEEQVETAELPPTRIVDMREELQAGNRSIFSRALISALEKVLQRGQQAILFLNRRGTATYVFCRDCGYALKCPHCDIPLTYHGPQSALICHRCGYRRKMPSSCPQCSSKRIRQYGTGTARVESEVQALFPQIRTLRWDYETTRQKGAHDAILGHFVAHHADVLIGTQMLAKGLDLPLVTLVGVVLADVGLNLPDYRAAERTFQVLTQVAGRAGRSPLGGEVILQTFQPEHYAIQSAARHDYRAFYKQELEYRRQLGYPPFSQLVRLEFRDQDPDKAERSALQMAARIRGWLNAESRRATQLIGPVPCFFGRIGGFYRWQIVLRGPDPVSLLRGHADQSWKIEVNPPNLL